MEDLKVIIVGNSDAGKVIEALEAISPKTPVILVDDFRDLDQEEFEIKQTPLVEEADYLLPTKKELHSIKMERFRKRRRK